MIRKIIVPVACAIAVYILVTSGSQDVIASAEYIKSAVTIMTVDSENVAECSSKIVGYSDKTQKVEIIMTVQRKNFWWWSDIIEWETTADMHSAELVRRVNMDEGTYRVKAVYIGIGKSDEQTVIGYSPINILK